ncbi:Transcriptional regulatory protein ZraR [uncultured Eubacterium sp.]|nr:Transcriptional regulatory protein ZraR [uncultured Eubacterium sp.]
MSYLEQIQTEVQQFAEVISEALHVETEIVDDSWQVTGATCLVFEAPVMEWNNTNSKITRQVFETKRALLLSDPGQNQLCAECTEKDCCFYKAGLYYPILLRGTCYGMISLVAFNEEQRSNIMDNSYAFMKFTSKMAEILAAKIQELIIREELSSTNEYLKTIISSVHEGIIACNTEGIITCLNETAEKKLGIASDDALGRQIAEVIPGSLLVDALEKKTSIFEKSTEYQSADGSPLHLISNVTLVKKEEKLLGAVESFNTDESLFRIAHRLLRGDDAASFSNIIGQSRVMRDVKSAASAIAKSPSTVLITGESGTGKELFARAIHNASLRSDNPFIPINCGAIPDALLESELFGYEGGSFTGAKASGKPGVFEMAQGGTIFLDEIGDMPLNLQVKVLRVLQEKTVQHIGSAREIPVDVRVIAATNQDLSAKIKTGTFREDLFYRLNVIPMTIPPLRERKEDLPLLIHFLCGKYAQVLNREITGLSEDALDLLYQYDWPGNIRELENAVEYAINYTFDGGLINAASLPRWLSQHTPQTTAGSIEQMSEREKIKSLLQTNGASLEAKRQIAEFLGISLATLYRKIKKYEL